MVWRIVWRGWGKEVSLSPRKEEYGDREAEEDRSTSIITNHSCITYQVYIVMFVITGRSWTGDRK